MGVRLDGGSGDIDEVHEINVTPFIDVILVLLIIFMVAAPLSTVDIAVDLPSAAVTPTPRAQKPVFLTIKPDLSLSIGDSVVSRTELRDALLAAVEQDTTRRIYLRADKAVPYGALMEVMNSLREAGLLKVSLVALERAP